MNTMQFNIPFITAHLLKPTVQDYVLSDYMLQRIQTLKTKPLWHIHQMNPVILRHNIN